MLEAQPRRVLRSCHRAFEEDTDLGACVKQRIVDATVRSQTLPLHVLDGGEGGIDALVLAVGVHQVPHDPRLQRRLRLSPGRT